MFRSILVAMLLAVVAMADMNTTVQNYVDEIEIEGVKEGGWIIENKKRTMQGESFTTTFTKYKVDANSTEDDELVGTSLSHDINYTTTDLKVVSTLTNIPTKGLDKNETALIKDIINKKLVVLRGDYSLTNHLYNISIDDINESLSSLDIYSKDIKSYGYYDSNSSLKEETNFHIASLEIVPKLKGTIGNFLHIRDLSILSNVVTKGDIVNLSYKTSANLVDFNDTMSYSKLEKLNIDIDIVNIDADSYHKLQELSNANPDTIDLSKVESLGVDIVSSKGLVIDIKDISIESLISENKEIGSAKIDAKISIDIDPKSAKLISINPLMALSFIKVNANIELSKTMMAYLMRDPRAMMLAMLPPKEKDGKIIYKIEYANSKLVINGQKF
jgi:hypothetical protein